MSEPSPLSTTAAESRTIDRGLVTYTNIMYALHAIGVVVGVLTAATIVGAFLFGLPSIIAIVMNYIRQSEVRGTWLESHFRWQRRTFWFAFLWIMFTVVFSAVFVLIVIGIFMIWIGFAIIGLWVLYRVIRGWLALRDGRPMYGGSAAR